MPVKRFRSKKNKLSKSNRLRKISRRKLIRGGSNPPPVCYFCKSSDPKLPDNWDNGSDEWGENNLREWFTTKGGPKEGDKVWPRNAWEYSDGCDFTSAKGELAEGYYHGWCILKSYSGWWGGIKEYNKLVSEMKREKPRLYPMINHTTHWGSYTNRGLWDILPNLKEQNISPNDGNWLNFILVLASKQGPYRGTDLYWKTKGRSGTTLAGWTVAGHTCSPPFQNMADKQNNDLKLFNLTPQAIGNTLIDENGKIKSFRSCKNGSNGIWEIYSKANACQGSWKLQSNGGETNQPPIYEANTFVLP